MHETLPRTHLLHIVDHHPILLRSPRFVLQLFENSIEFVNQFLVIVICEVVDIAVVDLG